MNNSIVVKVAAKCARCQEELWVDCTPNIQTEDSNGEPSVWVSGVALLPHWEYDNETGEVICPTCKQNTSNGGTRK